MLVATSRFGQIEVDDDKVITFKDGVLGFPQCRRYALIQTSPDPVFYWLQSVEEPNLAFLVCDPRTFVPEYQVPIRRDEIANLDLAHEQDCEVLVIVNKHGASLTGNLLGPLIVGATSKKGRQFVLSDKRLSTRHPLMTAPQPAQQVHAKSA